MTDIFEYIKSVKTQLGKDYRANRLLEASFHMAQDLTQAQRKSAMYLDYLIRNMPTPSEKQ